MGPTAAKRPCPTAASLFLSRTGIPSWARDRVGAPGWSARDVAQSSGSGALSVLSEGPCFVAI